MARPMGKTTKHRDFLKGCIDTDKMLDCLLAKAILSKEEVDEVKSRPSMCQKNQKLLDYIIEKDNEDEFISTLGDANQQHVANYLLNDGVRNQNKWNDWPLIPAKIQIIDVNCGALKDLLDIGGGLLDKLIARRVISHRHKQLISSKATDSDKNEALLDILRRGSMADYENTIQCLQDSNQKHIAEILDKGGAAVPVHVELREPLAEVRLVERITDLLRNRPLEESKRILEMATHKVIAAKIGDSIIFYFYCGTSELWRELKKAIISASLKVKIEELCKRVESRARIAIETIRILDHDQDKLDKYFSSKVRGSNISADLPLEDKHIKIIDMNWGPFKDVIEFKGVLVDKLLAMKVISDRQKQLICSKKTDSEKNDAFIAILRRGNIRDYENTIQCLRMSNQVHIAEILHDGGAIIPVHVELNEPLAEVRLFEILKDLLRNKTVEEYKRILETKKYKVIAAKLSHSIIFFCYCKTSKLWQELRKSLVSDLKITIEELCKLMDSQTRVVIKKIHIHAPDYETVNRYFAEEGIRRAFILSVLGIILACVAIILGIAAIYTT